MRVKKKLTEESSPVSGKGRKMVKRRKRRLEAKSSPTMVGPALSVERREG